MESEKKAIILIPEDPINKDKEQFRTFQRDGVTIEVAIGKMATVPLWVAVRAKEIGTISDYQVLD